MKELSWATQAMGQLTSLTMRLLAETGWGSLQRDVSGPWNLSGVASRENALGFDLELNSEQLPKN